MSTNTARLGLIKPAGADPQDVSQLNGNFDTLDKMAGFIMVNDGVTPPNTDLFDGAVVKEKTSGKVWVAQWNGTSYDKKYPYYTYMGSFKRTSGIPAVVSDTNFRNVAAFATYNGGVNSSASDMAAFNWKCPVGGWYGCAITAVWPSNASGYRGLRFGADTDMTSMVQGVSLSGIGTVQQHISIQEFAKNDAPGVYVWQNSGGNLGPNEVHIRIWSVAGGAI